MNTSYAPSENYTNWMAVIAVLGAGVLAACQIGKVSIALGVIQNELSLNLSTASWLISAVAIIGGVIGVFAGFAADRFGAKQMLIGGLLTLALGSGIGAISTETVSLLAGRVIEGTGFLGVVVAAPALIAVIASDKTREKAMTVWAPFMPIGLTLIMLTAPLMNLISWRGLWILNSILLVIYAIFLSAYFKGKYNEHKKPRAITEDLQEAVQTAGPWLLGALFCAYTAVFFTMFGFLPSYLSERMAISNESAAIISAVAVALSGIGNIICAKLLAAGFSAFRLLWFGFAAMAVCFAGVFSEFTPVSFLIFLCLLFPLLGGFVPVIIIAKAPAYAPRKQLIGVTMGFVMQGNNLGILVGPPIAGWFVTHYGWSHIILPVIVFAVIGMLITGALKLAPLSKPA